MADVTRALELAGSSSEQIDADTAQQDFVRPRDGWTPAADLPDLARDIVEHTADCIKVLDGHGRLLWMNWAGQQRLGIERFETVRCQYWPDMWRGEGRKAARKALALAMTGEVGRFSGPCATPAGEIKWWSVAVKRLPSRADQPVRLLSVSREVTDIVRATDRERMLRAAQRTSHAQAVTAYQKKAHSLVSVTHQLRTSLNGIVGWLDLLLEAQTSAEAHQAADAIHVAVQQQLRLISQVVAASHDAAGAITPQLVPVRLADVIERAVELVQPSLDAKEIGLRVDSHEQEDTILGDPDGLREALINLLTNAVRFTAPGGEIRVAWSVNDSLVALEVSDTGIGIEPSRLPRLFDGELRTAGNPLAADGMGLGLSIVRAIVSQHGGEVEARSAGLDRGTTVVMRWPVNGGGRG